MNGESSFIQDSINYLQTELQIQCNPQSEIDKLILKFVYVNAKGLEHNFENRPNLEIENLVAYTSWI